MRKAINLKYILTVFIYFSFPVFIFLGCLSLPQSQVATSKEEDSIPITSTETPSSQFKYDISFDHVTIKGYTGSDDNIKIPNFIEKKPVTIIYYRAFMGKSIKSIIIPDNVTTIWNEAFRNCIGLSEIIIPKNVTEIKDGGFCCCNDLKRIVFADGLRDIKIGWGAFASPSITEIIWPNNLAVIWDNVADGTGLSKVIIPDSVRKIGARSFKDCKNLTEIVLSQNITEIGEEAFEYSGLKKISLPDSLEKIGNNAFTCKDLTEIILPDNIVKVWDNTAAGSGLTKITIPDSVTEIGFKAFKDCANLSEIYLPKNINKIGDEAFDGCRSLTKVTFPQNLSVIGKSAFSRCKLTEINLPNSIIEIGENAFIGNGDKLTVIVPQALDKKYIGYEYFPYFAWYVLYNFQAGTYKFSDHKWSLEGKNNPPYGTLYATDYAYISTVEKNGVFFGKMTNSDRYILPPGSYIVTVYYSSDKYRSKDDAILNLTVKDGKKYKVIPNANFPTVSYNIKEE